LGRGDVRIDGRFHGATDVHGAVAVGPQGCIQGPVRAHRVTVEGRVVGDVVAYEEVRVAAQGCIEGRVVARRVHLEDGGQVRGKVSLDAQSPPGGGPAQGVRLEVPRTPGQGGQEGLHMPPIGRRRGRLRRGLPWLLGLVMGVASCASPALTLRPEPRTFTPDDYMKVHDAWTRDAKAFSLSRLSDVLHVSATFESWEFRWAYVIRYADDYALAPPARDAMLRATLADAQKHHRFFVTLAGERFKESDLTGKLAAWRVLLVDEHDNHTVPVEIEKVRRIGPVERVYFPSVSPYRMTFRVVFPVTRPDGAPSIPPNAREVTLRFTGAYGQVDLTWEVAAGSPPGA
jgi:hypothetical protein